MKNSGLFLNMTKWYFWGVCFFEVLILKGLFLVCLVLFQKCYKCLFFFPSFLAFSGVAHGCSSGFGRFRCFCVSCVCFSFLSCFCFCFVCFFGFVVGCCCCFLLFVFCFVLFLFVFLGGFKGHVRWPEGPPHLALNPPYLFWFFFSFPLFSFLFFLFFCLFFWRV